MTNCVSHAADSYIDVEDFVVGDCAEVHYTAPTLHLLEEQSIWNRRQVIQCFIAITMCARGIDAGYFAQHEISR